MEDRAGLLRRVRRVRIATQIWVRSTITGQHRPYSGGSGLELADIRENQPGDYRRTIDWKVTARCARPYVREFAEDREQTFYLAVDRSGSTCFGASRAKADRIAELAVSLLVSAINNRERVGLCLFLDRVDRFVPARGGRTQLGRVLAAPAGPAAAAGRTDLGVVLHALTRRLPRRCTVVRSRISAT